MILLMLTKTLTLPSCAALLDMGSSGKVVETLMWLKGVLVVSREYKITGIRDAVSSC